MKISSLPSGSVAVVIPAYNENQNLPILVKKILVNLPDCKIIIVDDSAVAGNKKLRVLMKRINNNILVISRFSLQGRGSAVLAGFKKGLEDNKIKYFFEMDADLSHDPDEFKLFLETKHKTDLIIGSRYLNQSRILNWPLRRLVQSRIINFFLKYWLGLNLTDYTNGFRLYNRRAVEYLSSITINQKGYIALSEIAYRLKNNSFTLSEVPISFTDRQMGKSNTNFRELIRSLIGAFNIRFMR